VLLGKVSFAWLSSMVEDLFCEAEVAEFFKLSREESFIVQRHSNRSGCFSVLEVYGVAVIDAPLLCPREKKAGVDFLCCGTGKGSRHFRSFSWQFYLGLDSQRPVDGMQAIGVGDPSSSTTSKVLSLGGSYVHSLGSGSRGTVP
jgi:hypothetical protein